MRFTEEMINEDEKRWHARDIVTELGYCGNYMRDRKNMTNMDIRFYAYIMRKAYYMLKEQEAVKPTAMQRMDENFSFFVPYYLCGNCRYELVGENVMFCAHCGRKVKWND